MLGSIDNDAKETIKVQGKASGLWFVRKKASSESNAEECISLQRPPITHSNSMWLLRKPLVDEPVENPQAVTEPVKESAKSEPSRPTRERSMTTSNFWPARMSTKDEPKEASSSPQKQIKGPSPSRSDTLDDKEGKNFQILYFAE